MKKETKTVLFLEHYVQVTDLDSGGDVYHPVYVLMNQNLSGEELEEKAIRAAEKSPNNIISMTGNTADYEYGGPTGRTVQIETITQIISDTENIVTKHTKELTPQLPEFDMDTLGNSMGL